MRGVAGVILMHLTSPLSTAKALAVYDAFEREVYTLKARTIPMKKMTPAASPDAYVEALDGWRRTIVEGLRSTVRTATALEEVRS